MEMTVAKCLASAIASSGASQKDLARAAGFQHPNIITMMKQGITKVPLDRAPALARAVGLDSAAFVRLIMREYQPAAWQALEDAIGQTLTHNELRLIHAYRDACGAGEVEVDDKVAAALRQALRPR